LGGGSGTPPAITVQVDPNPLVETGPSLVAAVIQVETSPSFAGDPVEIDSSQLTNSCGGIIGFLSDTAAGLNSVTVILDDDGNASVVVDGTDCAPGPSLIEADLVEAPYYTATTTLTVEPPNVTAPGVGGFPTTSGIVTTGEVETGDTPASGDSDVYAVFYVETDPVYAELPVEISSTQLQDRCGGGYTWTNFLGGTNTSTLDNDGNAVFVFLGSSCGAGSSVVEADVAPDLLDHLQRRGPDTDDLTSRLRGLREQPRTSMIPCESCGSSLRAERVVVDTPPQP